VNQSEFEAQENRGNRALSPDGKCVVVDDGFYLCHGMTRWLNSSVVNEKGKNHLAWLTNFKTGDSKYRGVVAHVPKSKGGGIFINYCPFCGSDKVLNYPEVAQCL